jgi:type IV pilus assembly protein PilM
MFDRPTATFPLGLEQDGKLLRGALLTHERGRPIVERVFDAPLEIAEPVACVLAPIQTLSPPLPRDRLRRALFVSGMPTEETLIRPLEVKLNKTRDIDAVLNFQAEPLIPYPIENAVIDRWILGTEGETTSLSVLSVRKDHLQNHLLFYESIKIEPEVISCYPAGLATFARYIAGVEGPTFVVHLARKTISCLLADNGKVLAAHAVPTGVEPILEGLRGLSNDQIAALDFNQSSQAEVQRLAASIDTLRQAVVRAVFALTKQLRGKDVRKLLVTGEGAFLGNIAAHLAHTLKKDLIVLEGIKKSALSPIQLATYAIPIGLAYSALPPPASADQINFRRGEFAYPNPWRRLKKPMALYIASSLLLAIGLYAVTGVVSTNHERVIKKQYLDLLQSMGKTYRSFELEMQGKAPTPELLEQPAAIPFQKLTTSQLEARLNALQKQVDSTPEGFPLQPDIPRVSDVLAWISSHAHVTKVESQTGKRHPLIQLDSFNYAMTKRPDKTKPKEHYQVKVDLEFTSPDSKSAREFYDALVEPNDIADPKSEVSWSAGQGKYRISFYLRDRTIYP